MHSDHADGYSYIDSNEALVDCAEHWGRTLAIDTEFMRTDTFYAIPGLYQLAAGSRIFLIDPQSIDDWGPLVDALENPAITIVMHSCSEDLELMYTHLGVRPNSLVDTQLAHAFLTDKFSVSYANLVQHWQGTEINKEATRSDWLQRPLTADQCHYAAEDVRYLVDIYQKMCARLETLGRRSWCEAEAAARLRYRPVDPERYYLQVKSVWRLKPAQVERLRALCAWREREAMRRDQPRNRVLRDEWLVALARAPRLTDNFLHEELPAGAVRRFGDTLRAIHASPADDLDTVELELPEQPLTTGQSKRVQRLRDYARGVAEELGMAPELLSRKRDVEAWMREFLDSAALPTLAASWRAPLLSEAFKGLLQETEALES